MISWTKMYPMRKHVVLQLMFKKNLLFLCGLYQNQPRYKSVKNYLVNKHKCHLLHLWVEVMRFFKLLHYVLNILHLLLGKPNFLSSCVLKDQNFYINLCRRGIASYHLLSVCVLCLAQLNPNHIWVSTITAALYYWILLLLDLGGKFYTWKKKRTFLC